MRDNRHVVPLIGRIQVLPCNPRTRRGGLAGVMDKHGTSVLGMSDVRLEVGALVSFLSLVPVSDIASLP